MMTEYSLSASASALISNLPPELDQVDVVLVLLRANLVPDVEAIIGHPVTMCPPGDSLDRLEGTTEGMEWLDNLLSRMPPSRAEIEDWRVHRSSRLENLVGRTVRQLLQLHAFTWSMLDDALRSADIVLACPQ